MKKVLVVFFCIFLAACQGSSENTLKTVDEGAAKKLQQSLDSGKAVIVGDVYLDDRYCPASTIALTNTATNSHQLISNGSVVSLGVFKDAITVIPGSYRITSVSCGNAKVKLGGNWADILAGTDKIKKALSPTFSVSAGEILHIGTMKINIIKKQTFVSNAKVIVTREATSPEAKSRAREALSNIGQPIRFTN